MSCLVIGSGWHPDLFRAEIEELIQPFELERIGNSSRIVSIDANKSDLDSKLISKLSRSGTLDELLYPSGWISISKFSEELDLQKDLIHHISNWINSNLNHIESGSIAVRWMSINGGIKSIESSVFAGYLGSVFVENGWSVDLEKPSTELMLILDGGCGIVCWGIRKITESPRIGWKERVATERPFFKPISLDPILAKVMVNLTGIQSSSEGYLCDPMCGTGGVLMEAALMDVPYVGIDFDKEMVLGSKENLNWIHQIHNITKSTGFVKHGNAMELNQVLASFPELSICGFAFDPPYGRNSWQSEKGSELLSSVLEACNEQVSSKIEVKLLCVLPWQSLNKQKENKSISLDNWNDIYNMFEKTNWKIIDSFSIHVHGSMSRLLIRASNL